jgi:hypothetical protein
MIAEAQQSLGHEINCLSWFVHTLALGIERWQSRVAMRG